METDDVSGRLRARIPTYLLLDLPAAGQRIPTYLFWGGPVDTYLLADRNPVELKADASRRIEGGAVAGCSQLLLHPTLFTYSALIVTAFGS